MKLTIDINPAELVTAQQKGAIVRGGRVRFFTKKRVRDCENRLVAALRPFAAEASALLTDKPIKASLLFVFPFPKSATKAERKCLFAAHTVRPDVDNLAKGVIDAMTAAGFWPDDSAISTLHLEKARAEISPRIEIEITPDRWF